MNAVGTFEAIKRSSFFNAIFNLCPSSEKASAEIGADVNIRVISKKMNKKIWRIGLKMRTFGIK